MLKNLYHICAMYQLPDLRIKYYDGTISNIGFDLGTSDGYHSLKKLISKRIESDIGEKFILLSLTKLE